MSKPTNPECEVYWAQMVMESESDARTQNPDDTRFYRTILMIDAQLRYYRGKLQDLANAAKEGAK